MATVTKKQAERREARIHKMLALLAEKPYYRNDLAREMGISYYTLYFLTSYAIEQNWIVSQGKYYLNPNTVMVAGGKVVKVEGMREPA